LVSIFGLLRKNVNWLAVFPAVFLKFIFLIAASNMVAKLFLGKSALGQITAMFSWPQLFTALSGGLVAYLFLKNKNIINHNQ
jgi:hypothetical protein